MALLTVEVIHLFVPSLTPRGECDTVQRSNECHETTTWSDLPMLMLPLHYRFPLNLTSGFRISVCSHDEAQQGLVPSELHCACKRRMSTVNKQTVVHNVLLLQYSSIYHWVTKGKVGTSVASVHRERRRRAWTPSWSWDRCDMTNFANNELGDFFFIV